MIRRLFLLLLFAPSLFTTSILAQNNTFADISGTPQDFTVPNVAARMVEGLGFRYYWASKDLRSEDLVFDPVDEGRNMDQTIGHLLGLSEFLLSAVEKRTFMGIDYSEMTFDQKRELTLDKLEKARDILRNAKVEDFESFNITFQDGNQLPFWNAINGPIADAIYHTGQIVMMRRMSGNPIASINVLAGVKN